MSDKAQVIRNKLNQMANGEFGNRPKVQQAVLRDAVREGVIQSSELAEAFGCAEKHLYTQLKTVKPAKLASHIMSLGYGSDS